MHICRTYFNITSEEVIDVNLISNELNIDKNDIEVNKNLNSINIGTCIEYDININNMLRNTLSTLFNKVEVLIKLKEKYNFTFYLERVVEIDINSNEPTPILGLDSDIIAFLHQTNTIDDIDYYIV